MMNMICIGLVIMMIVNELCDLRENNLWLYRIGFWNDNDEPDVEEDDFYYDEEKGEWLCNGKTQEELETNVVNEFAVNKPEGYDLQEARYVRDSEGNWVLESAKLIKKED